MFGALERPYGRHASESIINALLLLAALTPSGTDVMLERLARRRQIGRIRADGWTRTFEEQYSQRSVDLR